MPHRVRGLVAAVMLVSLLGLAGPAPARGGCDVAGEMVTIRTELWVGGEWQDISADVYNEQPVRIRRGVPNEGGRADPSEVTLALNNGQSKVATGVLGRYSPRNPRSDLYGQIGRNTPIRVSAGLDPENLSTRFTGEVTQWPPRWGLAGEADSRVQLQAAGILRRLGTPGRPLRDSLTRWLQSLDLGLVDWWPLTTPASRTDGEALFFHQEFGTVGTLRPQFGDGALFPWLPPGLAIPEARNEQAQGNLRADLGALDDGRFALDFVYRLVNDTQDPDDSPIDLTIRLGGEDIPNGLAPDEGSWSISTGSSTLSVSGPDTGGNPPPQSHDASIYDGDSHLIRLEVQSGSGTDADYELFVDGVSIGGGSFDTGAAAPQAPDWVNVRWLAEPVGTPSLVMPFELGHLLVWGSSAPAADEVYTAVSGHRSETAAARFGRLCREGGVAASVVGNASDSMPMGPQHPRRFLQLLDEAAAAEAAGSRLPILTEQREALGLQFRTRRSFYVTS